MAFPPKKILVPIDFSKENEEALKTAIELASLVKAEIELLHVLTAPEVFYLYEQNVEGNQKDLAGHMRRVAYDKLKEIVVHYPSVKMTETVSMGSVSDEICQAAKKGKVDLIVISTHGRTGLSHFLMGSVAEQVLRYAPCSVLSFCPSHRVEKRKEFIRNLQDLP